MKRIIFPLVLLLASAAVSCEKLETFQEEELPSVPMTFSASVDADHPETRASVSETNTVSWTSQDAISVFDVNLHPSKNAEFTLQESYTRDAKSQTFKVTSYDFYGSVPVSEDGYYGLYPYQDCSSSNYGLFLDTKHGHYLDLVWAGYHQNATSGSFDPKKALLLAYTPANSNVMNFKHVFAYIKLTVTFPLQKILVRGYTDAAHGDSNLATLTAYSLTLKMDSSGNPVVSDPIQEYNSDGTVILQKDTETILKTENSTLFPGTYLIAVIPQTLAGGLEIEFQGIDSSLGISTTQKKSTTKSVTLTRGNILNMGTFSTESFVSKGEWTGKGTAEAPYEITSVEQWNLFAERVNGSKVIKSTEKDASPRYYKSAHYKLMNNIDCGGAVLSAVGLWKNAAFEGTFDGGNFTISNYVAGRSYYGSGLFGYIKNATVKNLKVQPASILGYKDITNGWCYSPLIAESGTDAKDKWVIIDNCHVLAPASAIDLPFRGEDVFCGGILGASRGNVKITGCTNAMPLTVASEILSARTVSHGSVGGIIGGMWKYDSDNYCIIDRCKNTGEVSIKTNSDGYAGGIIGCDIDIDFKDVTLRLTNCMNSGNVYVNHGNNQDEYFMDAYAGGIVGYHDSDGDDSNGDPYIYNCLNTGAVYACQADSFAGGILGSCYDVDTDVYNCANTGEVTAGNSPQRGGICGSDDGTYAYCHWSCSLSYMLDATSDNGHVTGCSQMTSISTDTMNGNLTKIPSSAYTYATWILDSGKLSMQL